MTGDMTAGDVARAYSREAAWVPCIRQKPPDGEPVEVLYDDGMIEVASLSGRLFLMENGNYRYVNPAFWRPV